MTACGITIRFIDRRPAAGFPLTSNKSVHSRFTIDANTWTSVNVGENYSTLGANSAMNRLIELQNIWYEVEFMYSTVFHMYKYKRTIMVCGKFIGYIFLTFLQWNSSIAIQQGTVQKHVVSELTEQLTEWLVICIIGTPSRSSIKRLIPQFKVAWSTWIFVGLLFVYMDNKYRTLNNAEDINNHRQSNV